jgi:hypothetical protein
MLELMIGIDGIQRRMTERPDRKRRGDDGKPSRLRAALASRSRRPAEPRRERVPLADCR